MIRSILASWLLLAAPLLASGPQGVDIGVTKAPEEQIIGVWQADDRVFMFRRNGTVAATELGQEWRGTYTLTATKLTYAMVSGGTRNVGDWNVALLGDHDLKLQDPHSRANHVHLRRLSTAPHER